VGLLIVRGMSESLETACQCSATGQDCWVTVGEPLVSDVYQSHVNRSNCVVRHR
jgi:hypothetical protein